MDVVLSSESDIYSYLRQHAPRKSSRIPHYANDGMLRHKPRIILENIPQPIASTPDSLAMHTTTLHESGEHRGGTAVYRSSDTLKSEVQEPSSSTSTIQVVTNKKQRFSFRRKYRSDNHPLFYRLRKLTKTQVAMYVLAALLFAGGLGISLDGWKTNVAVHAQVNKLAENASSQAENAPQPTSPGVTTSTLSGSKAVGKAYTVASDLAKYLKIPSIAVNARVVSVGTLKDGSIGTPTPNTNQVGWYDASSKPGKSGAMLIDGHVSGLDTVGVFYKLKNLNLGDTVEIVKGDDQTISYRVVKVVTYDADKVDMVALANPADFSRPGLNLITCAGKYDTKSGEFNQRTVVFTVQI